MAPGCSAFIRLITKHDTCHTRQLYPLLFSSHLPSPSPLSTPMVFKPWLNALTPPFGGGGGGTASLKVTTHCQTTAPVFQGSPPLSFFYRPLFLGVADHRPLKSDFLNAKLYTKVTPIFPQDISCNEYHVFHQKKVKTNTSYKLLPLFGS